ncbi:MAG TPA: hypothetical protein IAC24_04005 [Candidatus Onthousia faecigallinarum]|nr:hypothetical protein [Candidatus Onthousia faecigallinarum]
MNQITKENLEEFFTYYHGFHDSFIKEIHYDTFGANIELLIYVYWSGKPLLKENNTYQTNRTKMKMVLKEVEQCNIKEIFSWDYINQAFLKYVKLNNKEFLCFASEEEEPMLYVVCKSIEYEDLKESW